MPYAVAKIEASTGRVVAVIGRGLLLHHADRLAADLRPRTQDGHYMKVINENELPERQETK